MACKHYATEEIIQKLREADVLIGQGQTAPVANKYKYRPSPRSLGVLQ